MKTTPLDSFLKFYVMGSTQVDLYGIAHVKVDFISLQKMYVIPRLGRFVWTTRFVQCGCNRLVVNIFRKTVCFGTISNANWKLSDIGLHSFMQVIVMQTNLTFWNCCRLLNNLFTRVAFLKVFNQVVNLF